MEIIIILIVLGIIWAVLGWIKDRPDDTKHNEDYDNFHASSLSGS